MYRSKKQHRQTLYYRKISQLHKILVKCKVRELTKKEIEKSLQICQVAASKLSQSMHQGFFIRLCLILVAILARCRTLVLKMFELAKKQENELGQTVVVSSASQKPVVKQVKRKKLVALPQRITFSNSKEEQSRHKKFLESSLQKLKWTIYLPTFLNDFIPI